MPVQMPLDAMTAEELLEVCTLQTPSKNSDPGPVSKLLGWLDIEASLSITEKKEVFQVISEFADVFALTPAELGHTEQVQHIIDTGDYPLIKQLPHQTSFALRKLTEEMIANIVEEGIVKPSSSPWASPVVLVAKKDSSIGFCVDYHWLNSITRKDTYPLPRVDDSLDLLAQTSHFNTLNLVSGHWQVGKETSSQPQLHFLLTQVYMNSQLCHLDCVMPWQLFKG